MNKRIKSLILVAIFAFANIQLFSVEFKFKFAEGDSYRILSTVQEDVLVNGQFDHYAEIVNRISVSVDSVEGNKGIHSALFMTSESSTNYGNRQFTWGEEYESKFTRDSSGKYTISDEYFMPVVRDVPIFPDKDVQVGDTWTAEGHEAHDMRRTFGINKPFKVPFSARYTYAGTVQEDGKTLHLIDVQYNLYYSSPMPTDLTVLDYPAITMGYSHQNIYWDNEKGAIDHYNEDFRIIVETARGNVFEFIGTAQAEITEFKTHAVDRLAEVQETINQLGIQNTEVRADDEGLTISMENIQFKPDSAELLDSEKRKLRQIAEILKQFPENDLLISGHTALAGTASARQELSEQRAQSVASYLMELGVKDAYHIFTQGFGAERPIAPNTTEEGKARNRRVEITIMDR
ncbi:MAG: OmpA family protein [Spirochaetaceae bacterium]|nr:OmpA family protein [Spirochaetaceae bacterium]MBO5236303.1 OmpA family protein [Spirochaetaceae bacterium]